MAPARAIVDLDAIVSNYRHVRERVGSGRTVYAVVKADAYGHGATAVARRLAEAGVDRFVVANAEEGMALRRAGILGEILMLCHAEPSDLAMHRAYGLTPTLYDLTQARSLVLAARGLSEPLNVQLEIDAGLGRAGIRPEALDEVIELLRGDSRVRLSGTYANFSSASDPSSPDTDRQIAVFEAGIGRLRASGVAPGLVHLANSAGVMAHPRSWLDGVRPGLALYGVAPSPAIGGDGLVPAMTVEARITSVRRVPAGTPLGYGGRFVTARDTTVAVLPIGYADGYRRCLSGRTDVLLRGRRAPVVGAVSMDVTLVDATGIGVERGDRAILLGRDGDDAVTAWDLARAADTIPYEILCGIGPRVRRVYAGSVSGRTA